MMNLLSKLAPVLAAAAISTTAVAGEQFAASMLTGEIAFGGSQKVAPWSISFGPQMLATDRSMLESNSTSNYSVSSLKYLSVTRNANQGVVLSAFGTAIAQKRDDSMNQLVIPSVIWADGGASQSGWWASNWWIPVVGVVGVAAAASGSSDGSPSSGSGGGGDGKDGVCNTPSNESGQVTDPDCESNVEVN